MKHILLVVIRVYWITIPEKNRRSCLFSESCSRFVYRITTTEGIIKGLSALNKRFHQCRPGYTLIKNEKYKIFELHLKDGTILKKEELAPNLHITR